MIEIVGDTSSCAPCRALKARLEGEGIEFTYYNLNSSDNRFMELYDKMRELGVRSIPAVFVDGEYKQEGI